MSILESAAAGGGTGAKGDKGDTGATGATGAAGAAGATGATGPMPTLQYAQVGSLPLTISDLNHHSLCSVTVVPTSGQKVKITASLCFKNGAANAGLFTSIKESSTYLLPADQTNSGDFIVKQTTDAEWFTLVGILTPSAASHTYTLDVSQALSATTTVIRDGYLLAEVYN